MKAGGCYVLAAALLAIVHTSSAQVLCRGAKLQAVGCFNDKRSSPRPLPVLLFTDRDKKNPKFSSVSIPTSPNAKYIKDNLCRCARSAMLKGYDTVGVQAGECLSGPKASSTFLKDGRSGSCLGLDSKACKSKADSCIGKLGSNFVYKVIKDAPKPTTKKPTTKKTTKKPTTKKATTKKPGKPTTKKPTAKPGLTCTSYNVTLKINKDYNYGLCCRGSSEFGKLRVELDVGVMQVYDGYKPFKGVHILKFDKASDGKTNCNFAIHFSTNGTHLGGIEKKIASGKLGKLAVDKTFAKKGCYKVCPTHCLSVCAPSCSSSCCALIPPPILAPVSPCGATCPASCAPSCSPSCCAPSPPPLPPPPVAVGCPYCSPVCAPRCSSACCSLTRGYKRNHVTHQRHKPKNRLPKKN